MTDADHIARIDAITRNARNTWFALLGVLVFVGITLMGVEHIDFYGVNRATKLPLVDVEVPTKSFFFAAPVLTAAIFGYFHLYLIRLWDALGAAPPSVNDQPLGDAISPWLVTDAALHLRSWLRGGEPCTNRRTLEGPAMFLNIALAWGFGLGILGWLWMASMPARDILITGVAALALLIALFSGASSLAMLALRMRPETDKTPFPLWQSAPAMAALVVLIPFLASFSLLRTAGPAGSLAELNLYAENLVEKPLGWLPHDLARKDFLKDWCDREDVEDCKALSAEQQKEFDEEWKTRRDGALADLTKPDWHKKGTKPNFSKANLFQSFLSGANLSGAQMEGADLSWAQMEGADLSGAQMERAVLIEAQMQGANLWRAQMEGAILWRAQMEGASLWEAQMQGADLIGAQMEGAYLIGAQMEGADLIGAQMEGADLSFSLLTGTATDTNILQDTNLRESTNGGGALRFVDLRPAIFDARTDFRNAFMDGSVELPDGFVDRMGGLCQRMDETLDDPEFYGRWRGWVEAGGHDWTGRFGNGINRFGVSPPGWENVTAIPPPDGCEWKTGPMPGSEPAK